MYAYLDRAVADLPRFERALLGSIRRWVHALTLAGEAPVSEDQPAFDAAMHALNDGSRESLAIQRPCFATVDETEAVILGWWRLVRDGETGSARRAAMLLVEPAQADAMVAAMARAVTQ